MAAATARNDALAAEAAERKAGRVAAHNERNESMKKVAA
jgi:hypothetical protein